jgi:hypothetical protein
VLGTHKKARPGVAGDRDAEQSEAETGVFEMGARLEKGLFGCIGAVNTMLPSNGARFAEAV